MTAVSVQVDGVQQTLNATRQLEAALRRQTNGELRKAAGTCAAELLAELQGAAGASGVPVAPLVARSMKVRSDRLPVVAIGGSLRVGRYGGTAGQLVWGSEHGGHNFAVPRGPGYWIRPTVERFKASRAVAVYQSAIAAIIHAAGL